MNDPEQPSPASPSLERTVPVEAAGMRLDLFLARHAGLGTRRWLKELAQHGGVLVDGRAAKPGATVAPGQRVTLIPGRLPVAPVVPEPPSPAEALTVLYEDSWIVVIDKPPGLAAHPPTEVPRPGERSVASIAAAQFGPLSAVGGADRPGIVHRLDKETSGAMVLARSDEAMHFLKAQFRARAVDKEYLAIVYGRPRFDSDWIERNLAPHPTKGDRMVAVADGGRAAQTFYVVVERFDGFTHVRCEPKTGRTHQIRVHMASLGHSLVGDRLYRSRNAQQAKLPDAAPDPGRHALHARRLAFEHPLTRERLVFEAPVPPDLAALLAWLRAHRGA